MRAAVSMMLASALLSFGAGSEEPPGAAGGGPGDLPVVLPLPDGARVAHVTETAGEVTPQDIRERTRRG